MSVVAIALDAQSFEQLKSYTKCLSSIVEDNIMKSESEPSFRIIMNGLFHLIDKRNRTGWFKSYQELLSILYFAVSHASYSLGRPLTTFDVLSYDECGWDPLVDPNVTDIYCSSKLSKLLNIKR